MQQCFCDGNLLKTKSDSTPGRYADGRHAEFFLQGFTRHGKTIYHTKLVTVGYLMNLMKVSEFI